MIIQSQCSSRFEGQVISVDITGKTDGVANPEASLISDRSRHIAQQATSKRS